MSSRVPVVLFSSVRPPEKVLALVNVKIEIPALALATATPILRPLGPFVTRVDRATVCVVIVNVVVPAVDEVSVIVPVAAPAATLVTLELLPFRSRVAPVPLTVSVVAVERAEAPPSCMTPAVIDVAPV